ncbi:hypothetical protein BKA70DRAFT_1260357 [Coprinopsis sp. MPI-PUGE-AT-0042]|nr:hypothetical protein BKA70DRAFT_1260357 [Coprinopsis sp. MPI-PUGE-AT-0042]
MRAISGIYESPELSASDVWSPEVKTRLASVIGAISVAAVASSVAVYQFTNVISSGSPKNRLLGNFQ